MSKVTPFIRNFLDEKGYSLLIDIIYQKDYHILLATVFFEEIHLWKKKDTSFLDFHPPLI